MARAIWLGGATIGLCLWHALASAAPQAQTTTSSVATQVGAAVIHPIDPRRQVPIVLRHTKTGERYELTLFDEHGQIRDEARTELREFLACPRTGDDHPIHWRLATIVAAIGARWPGHTIDIVSGYRHPRVSRHAKRSNHTRGRAIDLRVSGVPNRVLRDALRRSFAGIGVGYYPNSSFVHVDIREHDAQWIDYAGPGAAPCYSRDVDGDLRSGRAETLGENDARQQVCAAKHVRRVASSSADAPVDANDPEHDGTNTRRE